MTVYKGLFEGTGYQAVEPMSSYRGVLDAARTVAQRTQDSVRIIDADTGAAQMIVRPDGSTRRPG